MSDATCSISNCRKQAPASEPFCTDHRETKCEHCGGNGWVAKRNSLLGPGLYEVDCDTCGGFGWVEGPEGARP